MDSLLLEVSPMVLLMITTRVNTLRSNWMMCSKKHGKGIL